MPQSLLKKLEAIVDKHRYTEDSEDIPLGFDEVVRYLGLKEMSVNQAQKLVSFFNEYTPSNPEQRERYDMYGGQILNSFVQHQLKSIKNAKARSNLLLRATDHPTGTKYGNQTGREVDRLNNVSSRASLEPAKVTGQDLYKSFSLGEMYQAVLDEAITSPKRTA
ncbi:MAG: hypothetical protein HRT71_03945 [Flavobacteriales bacterium]|nr:hypothetical protein [Flavobacteriales bacterium]